MSGRCVACDSKLTEEEMCRKRHDTGVYLDMCTSCLFEVNDIVELPIHLNSYEGEMETDWAEFYCEDTEEVK